jgi:GNAT superfamily N-acetyltransferase
MTHVIAPASVVVYHYFMTSVIEVCELAGPTEIEQLVLSCSPTSLRRRFSLGGEQDPRDLLVRYLPYLQAGPPDGVALVGLAHGVPAGLLNLVPDAADQADLAVLVADPWQRQGIGSGLADWLWRSGRWQGWTVHATTQPDNVAAKAFLRRQGFRLSPSFEREQQDYERLVPDPAAIMTTVM